MATTQGDAEHHEGITRGEWVDETQEFDGTPVARPGSPKSGAHPPPRSPTQELLVSGSSRTNSLTGLVVHTPRPTWGNAEGNAR
jgi:hypothetical protein